MKDPHNSGTMPRRSIKQSGGASLLQARFGLYYNNSSHSMGSFKSFPILSQFQASSCSPQPCGNSPCTWETRRPRSSSKLTTPMISSPYPRPAGRCLHLTWLLVDSVKASGAHASAYLQCYSRSQKLRISKVVLKSSLRPTHDLAMSSAHPRYISKRLAAVGAVAHHRAHTGLSISNAHGEYELGSRALMVYRRAVPEGAAVLPRLGLRSARF
ncbi:hypothetical protein FKP32DRAFT_1688354 [Trametes sanguinea]|nr:hypothetical protein FKP32DRAFT_1688354 [Trametes sanguinea]